jgi:hypothetical protein
VLGQPASAATFTPFFDDNPSAQGWSGIVIPGEIVPGDAQRFRDTIAAMALLHIEPGEFVLDSPGGNVVAAAELADAVRDAAIADAKGKGAHTAPIAIEVMSHGICTSACVLVFFAPIGPAPQRYLFAGGRLGVHRAATSDGKDAPEASRFIAAKLAEFKVSQPIM